MYTIQVIGLSGHKNSIFMARQLDLYHLKDYSHKFLQILKEAITRKYY